MEDVVDPARRAFARLLQARSLIVCVGRSALDLTLRGLSLHASWACSPCGRARMACPVPTGLVHRVRSRMFCQLVRKGRLRCDQERANGTKLLSPNRASSRNRTIRLTAGRCVARLADFLCPNGVLERPEGRYCTRRRILTAFFAVPRKAFVKLLASCWKLRVPRTARDVPNPPPPFKISDNDNDRNRRNNTDRGRRGQQLTAGHVHHGLRRDRGQPAGAVAVEKRGIGTGGHEGRGGTEVGAAPRGERAGRRQPCVVGCIIEQPRGLRQSDQLQEFVRGRGGGGSRSAPVPGCVSSQLSTRL